MAYRNRGLDGAGKSSICAALLNEPLDQISPTLGFIIKTIEYDG
jgi:ADP-ribosylation factor-like protein 2